LLFGFGSFSLNLSLSLNTASSRPCWPGLSACTLLSLSHCPSADFRLPILTLGAAGFPEWMNPKSSHQIENKRLQIVEIDESATVRVYYLNYS
jgi:hypothetical protein